MPKRLVYLAIILFAISYFFQCDKSIQSTTTCILGFCFGKDYELQSRELSTEDNTFTVIGYSDDELTTHVFNLGESRIYEGLSFGLDDPEIYKSLTAKKRLQILNAAAYKTYTEKYLRVSNQCPASFIHQNLESVLLIPATDTLSKELENYHLAFSPDGTPFKLEGYFLTPLSSHIIKDGERVELTLATHEGALSNVGSANHKIHYFLVTRIDSIK